MSKKIEFQIEELEYQERAVNSVIDLLKGIDRYSVSSVYSSRPDRMGMVSSHPEANVRFNVGTRLVENLRAVQFANDLDKDSQIQGKIPQFTIEMETGTGKTFVYLETILRLWSDFGGQFKKFIIVVPSNPILLGVKKSIETFAEYFKPKFNNIDLKEHYFVFDKNVTPETVTAKLVESTDLSIMLITNHSFNKESNRLRKKSETGVVIWEDIRDIAPIVIIDEPQKLDGDGKKMTASMKALIDDKEGINPLMILRYSATHKNLYNAVYKLASYDAYDQHLVKAIKVCTVHSLTDHDFPYVRYVKFTKDLKAKIEIFCKEQDGKIRPKKFDVENNAGLEELSGGLPQYRNWYIAAQPRKNAPLQVICDNNDMLYLEETKSNDEADPAAAIEKQMRIAIKAHIRKQREILESGRKIKVLTLFFVDSVFKVRGDGEDGRGEYLKAFDRIFDEIRSLPDLIERNAYSEFPDELKVFDTSIPASAFREGYFAVDKNKKAVEVDGWNADISDEDVSLKAKAQEDVDRGIDLILNKKDELISFDEPLQFIFSHSALREGWDNPNVFVLVTLKDGGSDIARKQEVGRGLRLPVDTVGSRCYDNGINELTVVANDHFDHFAETLQKDYNEQNGLNVNEVTADVIKNTMVNAGIAPEKIEQAYDAFKREIMSEGIAKVDKSGKLILADNIKITADAVSFPNMEFEDPLLKEHSKAIVSAFISAMIDKGTKKIEIINGDIEPFENTMQKYVTEGEFGRMYKKLLEILQKKSVYKYKFDTERFLSLTAAEINDILRRKNDYIKFEVTTADVGFNQSHGMEMRDTQKMVEESEDYTVQYAVRPLFDIVNVIMTHTMLPRLAILKIIGKLTPDSRNKINNQDYLEEAIAVINNQLKLFKSDNFIEAQPIKGIGAAECDIFEVDRIANETDIRYVFTPEPSHRKAMNLKYKFDSDGEVKFAKALDNDDNVLLYTKLKKGGFVLETPAGNYSPDWAIVYQKNADDIAMYFIAETKWDKEWGNLTDDEHIKIKCATKHFEAVNKAMKATGELSDTEVLKYDWVNAYKDTQWSHGFPQVLK